MLSDGQSFEAKDGELLRIVLRTCNHDAKLTRQVILACQANNILGIASIIDEIRTVAEEMEGGPISTEELVIRIATAKPENWLTF